MKFFLKCVKSKKIIFFLLLTALILVEALLRILPLSFTKIDPSLASDVRNYSTTLYLVNKPNTSRNWSGLGTPTIWHFNNLGFRGESIGTNMPNGKVFRIVTLGDSVFMGLGVEEHESVPRQLEKYLKPKKFSGGNTVFVEVINLADWGSGGVREAAIMKNIAMKYKPNLVLVGSYFGDQEEDYAAEKNKVYFYLRGVPDTYIPYMISQPLKEKSYTFLFLLNSYYKMIEKFQVDVVYNDETKKEAWQVNNKAYEQIKKDADKIGAQVVVVGVPGISYLTDSNQDKIQNWSKNLSMSLAEDGIPFFDMSDKIRDLKDPKSLYLDPNHYTPEGGVVAAKIIGDYLIDNGFVQKPVE